MKISYLISLAVATTLFTGCGGGSSSDITGAVTSSQTVRVERGPILGATVVDATGQKAVELSNGEYKFATLPTYPIMATQGVIDMDRDGKVSIGDVVNDMNLTTTKGNVLTLLTTLATNTTTKTEVETLLNDLNLSVTELYSQTPSDSTEIEAISNVLYKYVKDNNISDLLDTNDAKLVTLNLSSTVLEEYTRYSSDGLHGAKQEEQDLVDSIDATKLQILTNDAEVQQEIENELSETELNEIENELISLKNRYELEHGDIDYEDEGTDSIHSQGVACASCHSINSVALSSNENEANENENEAGENVFDSGASIFTALNAVNNDATKAASNYSLRLVLEGGAVQGYRIGRGTGNVNATFNAGIAKYTAEVLDRTGKVVNSSLANSHDSSRFDCNSCHTSGGTSGAPGRIVSFKYLVPTVRVPVDTNTTTVPVDTNTTTPVVAAKSFTNDVLPILTNNCAGCHGSNGNFSITTATSAYAGVTPFVNTTTPTASALLTKASGTGHGGGTVIATTTTEYITVRDWISEGALNN